MKPLCRNCAPACARTIEIHRLQEKRGQWTRGACTDSRCECLKYEPFAAVRVTLPETVEVTRGLLAPLVEQPEPSTSGSWYVVPLASLVAEGFDVVEVHIADDADTPDMIRLIKGGLGND